MSITFKPLSDNVLIDYGDSNEEEKTKGGIIMTTKQRPQQGIAVAVGPGRKTKTGERSPMTVKVGDEVKFAAFAGREIKVDDKDYFLMPETDIQGIIEKLVKKIKKKDRPKIYERNPNTGVIRWRYVGESYEKFGWPNYGRILKTK